MVGLGNWTSNYLVWIAAALSDTVVLLLAAIGLVVMSLATPGSLQGSLHKVRQNAIDPAELQAKADASGLSIDMVDAANLLRSDK